MGVAAGAGVSRFARAAAKTCDLHEHHLVCRDLTVMMPSFKLWWIGYRHRRRHQLDHRHLRPDASGRAEYSRLHADAAADVEREAEPVRVGVQAALEALAERERVMRAVAGERHLTAVDVAARRSIRGARECATRSGRGCGKDDREPIGRQRANGGVDELGWSKAAPATCTGHRRY